MSPADRERWTADYHETCDKAARFAAMGMMPEALRLWGAFYLRWEEPQQ